MALEVVRWQWSSQASIERFRNWPKQLSARQRQSKSAQALREHRDEIDLRNAPRTVLARVPRE